MVNPFSGVLSHQILGTGCYWWPSLEYFIAGVQITCPKVGFKFPSACCWSNFQMTSQPLRTNLSLVLSICFYPIPASFMIWGLGICVYPLDGSMFLTVIRGGGRTDMEAHALFRTPSISLPVLLLLAGLFLQVKKSRMPTATCLSICLSCSCCFHHHSRYPHPPCTWPLSTVI